MFEELDPILHSQLCLSIINLLMRMKELDIDFLKEKTKATESNLIIHLTRLADADYLTVIKAFTELDAKISYRITEK